MGGAEWRNDIPDGSCNHKKPKALALIFLNDKEFSSRCFLSSLLLRKMMEGDATCRNKNP